MKTVKKIGVIIFIVLIVFLVIKDFLIGPLITMVGFNIIGAPMKVRSFSSSLIRQKVRIKGLRLYNPKGFPAEPFLDITEIGADYDILALLTGKLHLPLVIVNLKEMVVIKNKEGLLNVDSLKVTQTSDQSKEKKSDVKSKSMRIKMDVVKLNIDKVIYKDFSKEPAVIQVYDVGLKDKTFHNITSPEQLVTSILLEAMAPTAIKSAKVYAAAAILGVGFLPAGMAGLLIGKDDATADFKVSFDQAYDASLKLVQSIGELKTENRSKGTIQAKVDGSDVTVLVIKSNNRSTQIAVSARKYMIPRPEVAGGVLHQLTEKLK